MEGHGEALFYIGPIGITSAMVTMVAITIALVLVSYFATRHMKVRPRGLQNFMEKCVEMLRNFIGDMLDKKYVNRYLPFLGTLFIFSIIFLQNIIHK